jgi:hypothetical protein
MTAGEICRKLSNKSTYSCGKRFAQAQKGNILVNYILNYKKNKLPIGKSVTRHTFFYKEEF